MPQIALQPFAPSTKIYKGDEKCPRTVVIQQENLPGGGVDTLIESVFFSTDKSALDQATVDPVSGALSIGVSVGQSQLKFFNAQYRNQFTIVLESVTKDIYARAVYFDATTGVFETELIYLNVEAF